MLWDLQSVGELGAEEREVLVVGAVEPEDRLVVVPNLSGLENGVEELGNMDWIQGSENGVEKLGIRNWMQGLENRHQESGIRNEGLGFRVLGQGFVVGTIEPEDRPVVVPNL